MTAHRLRMHRTESVIDWSWLTFIQTVYQHQVYDISLPRMTNHCPCPLYGCPESSLTWNVLRSHFNIQHWGDWIRILEEHPKTLPRCKKCGIQVPTGRLSNLQYMSENF